MCTHTYRKNYSRCGDASCLVIASGPTLENLKTKKLPAGTCPRTPLLAFALHTVPNGFQKHRVPMLCPAIVPDLATPLLLQLIIAVLVDRIGTLRPRLSYATVNMNTSAWVMSCQWVTLHNM